MGNPNDKADAKSIADAISRIVNEGSIAVLATLIEAKTIAGETPAVPGEVGAKLLFEESGAPTGSLGEPKLDRAAASFATSFLESKIEAKTFSVREFAPHLDEWADVRILFERIEPEPRLVICGAGHVGAALARLANLVGYQTTLIDDRADFVVRERFPETAIELVAAKDWSSAISDAIGNGSGVYVAVVTRGHNEDEACMHAIMKTSASYVGLIGSKRRTNIVIDRLREAGYSEDRLRIIRAPIGLDIGAVSPQEVALAIIAEIVAERRGGACRPLSEWRRE
jgi:xanthine dehydrogenase accessory factor